MEITHVSHNHPLMFKEEVQNKRYGSLLCNACEDTVDGPYYSCNQCPPSSSFILHKSCAELPAKMHHLLHKNHPLTLLTNTNDYTCDVCNQEHYYPSFAYSCSKYKKLCFVVDLTCATTWRGIIENHHHKFRLSRKKDTEFNCEVCGMKGSNTVYICSICQLWVHKYCTSLLGHVRTRVHPRPLMLRWSVEDIIEMSEEVCKLCYTNMHRSRGFYYCEPCGYIAHNTCAVKEDIGDDDEIGVSKVDVAQQITSGDLQDKIKHFSHQQHFLTLISGHHEEIIIRCDGCMQPISPTDAFYSCMQQQEEQQQRCHFFLHTDLSAAQISRPGVLGRGDSR